MKKLLLGISFVAVMCLMGTNSEAAGAARGAKTTTSVNYTLSVSTIATGPVVLYSVTLASGAASEFVAIFDTAPAVAATINANQTSAASNLKSRLFFGSTTANTTINFDPPLQLNNGLLVADSAVTGQSLFVFERGRVTQGY